MNSKNKVAVTGLALLMAAGSVGGVIAYLTDAEVATNKFTIGDVSIEGLEPDWPGNDDPTPKDIVPNEEVSKNPMVDNKGTNDAIVFITVDSPLEKITVINDDGTVATAKSVNEVFWFKDAEDAKSTHANNFDAGWQELAAKEMYVKIAADGTETKVEEAQLATAYDGLAATDKLVKRYVFGYKQAVQGSSANDGDAQTAANKKTTNLFDKIQLKNTLEGEIDEAGEEIVVRYYAIQEANVLENSADLGATLNEANLGKIYDIFLNQNSANDNGDGLHVEGLRDADSVEATQNGASGTTDEHVNRWDAAAPGVDDPANATDHVKP